MANNNDTDRNEKLFEAMLRVAAEEAMTQEMDELPSREELAEMFPRSEAFDKRVGKIIGKHERGLKIKRVARGLYKAAAVFGIFFFVSIIALMGVEASRVFIFNTILNIRDRYVIIEFEVQDGRSNYVLPPNDTHPLYGLLPYGFAYARSNHLTNISVYIFENEAGKRIILQQNRISPNLQIGVDNVNRELTVKNIDGRALYVFEGIDDRFDNLVMWSNDRYMFLLSANLEIDKLMHIVRSMIERQF